MLLLLRWFHFHQHDFGGLQQTVHSMQVAVGHAHAHDHAHPPEQALGALGLFVGLCVHTIVDGMALGAVLVGAPMEAGAVAPGIPRNSAASRLIRCLSRPSWRPAAGHRHRDSWQVAVLRCCARWSLLLLWVRRPWWRLTSGYLPRWRSRLALYLYCAGRLVARGQFLVDRLRLTVLFLLGIAIAISLGWFEAATTAPLPLGYSRALSRGACSLLSGTERFGQTCRLVCVAACPPTL